MFLTRYLNIDVFVIFVLSFYFANLVGCTSDRRCPATPLAAQNAPTGPEDSALRSEDEREDNSL